MSNKPTFAIFGSSLIIMHNGKRISIPSGDERFFKAKELIKNEEWVELMNFVDVDKIYAQYNLSLKDGRLQYKIGETLFPLPIELSERIIAYKKEGLPLESLLAFWDKLKENPSQNSMQQLFKFLENNGHPFTDDGYFIAYKTVRPDFKDWHSNSMDNTPGKTLEIPRNMVNDNANQTCSEGLHACSWAYLANFHAEKERKIISIKIHPKDVVSVPVDYQNTKMRVCKYEVLEEVEADFSDILIYPKNKKFESYEEDDEECHYCYESNCSCKEDYEQEEELEEQEEEEENNEICSDCENSLNECDCTNPPPVPNE